MLRRATTTLIIVIAGLALSTAGTAVAQANTHTGSPGGTRSQAAASSGNQLWAWLNNTPRCIDDPGWSTSNGTGLDTWDCVPQANEQWVAVGPFTGYRGHIVFLLKNAYSGKCINDPAYSTSNGTRMVQWTCSRSDPNSQWYEQDIGSAVILHNEYSGKCLNVAGASTNNGAWLIQYTCSSSYTNEIFYVGP
jgi:Ricin-type beta-trefoil lectin domain-like